MANSGVLSQSTIIYLCTTKRMKRHQNCDDLNGIGVSHLNLELQGIVKIRGLDSFTNLTRLQLNNNSIEVVEGLDKLAKLESIDLSFNKIKMAKGFEGLLALKQIVISHNELTSIANSFDHLQCLEILALNSNRLRDVEEVDHLQKCTALQSLSLKSNPLCANVSYHERVLAVIPNLIYLDGTNCTKIRADYKLDGRLQTTLREEHSVGAERAIEMEKTVEEIPIKTAFVEEWEHDTFLSSGFLNKFDHAICNLPGNIENFEEFKKQVLEVCKRIVATGINSKRTRDSEISHFKQFIHELNAYFKMKSVDSIQQYYNAKEKIKSESELDDVTNERERLSMSRYPLDDLYYDLMKFEIELEEQLEENMDDFERTLLTLTDEFLQAIEAEVAICREVEDEYYEKVSNHCFHLLDKVPLEEMGVEVTPHIREMFEDKESLTEALADCHAEHLSSFDSKVDKIRERCQSWLKKVLLELRGAFIEERRKARVFEIHHFMETQWNKENSAEASKSLPVKQFTD